MAQRRVFLVPSDDHGWAALRSVLAGLPEAAVIGEERDPKIAITLFRRLRPDLVLAAAPIVPSLAPPMVDDPAGMRVALFASTVAPADLPAFFAAGVTDVLLWDDLTVAALSMCLTALLAGAVSLFSRSVPLPFAAGIPFSGHALGITARERAILRDLAAGLTQEQIAAREGIGVRTVKRAVAGLQDKLNAPGQFALGRRAEQLGIVA